MTVIDRETQQRILDAADIVEVVGDFVSLKRRGANYIGLCPFHNERTPSFSVSKSRGICKCFSCGKGGSPVNFLMELENMSFQEALRWLAKKYNIEIKEREVSEEERRQEQERESMLVVNDFAMKYFETVMTDTQEGRDVGRAYFTERGVNDLMVKRFHLGYSLNKGSNLRDAAIKAGYKEQFLLATGLCAKSERDGSIYDRFRGRVIYPVFSLSGKVVAFGGRILTSDKTKAKYVNSPESIIYSKSKELYGLYQSRQAITRKDKCILVEGYMDVISMHQSGVENVVASSGTSLTEGQIRLIQRFTSNVTVVYDSDAAGIKASLRGIDMLLAAGMNVKVLQFPAGEDPDSFAQSHSCEELEQYLASQEVDFIKFKTRVLLADVNDDPVLKSKVINDIIESIAVIPNAITRQLYIEECARIMQIDQKLLAGQLTETLRHKDNKTSSPIKQTAVNNTPEVDVKQQPVPTEDLASKHLYPFEKEIVRYALRYGVFHLCDAINDEGGQVPLNVVDYIEGELANDDILFANADIKSLWNSVCYVTHEVWPQSKVKFDNDLVERRKFLMQEGIANIRKEASNMSEISAREATLNDDIEKKIDQEKFNYARNFIVKLLISDANDVVRHLATELSDDKYELSKVHTKYRHIETEDERLVELVPRSVFELKNAILYCRIKDITRQIADAQSNKDFNIVHSLMTELIELNRLKGEFAKYLGERIITP